MKGDTGYRELTAALVLSRVFVETAPMPDVYHVYGMQRFTVIAVSFLLTAAVYIPLWLAMRRTDEGLPDRIASGNKALSGFAGALFSLYLLSAAAETGLRAHYYTSSTIFDSAPSVYFYVFVGAALIFAAVKDEEATVRTAVVISGMFLLLLIIMTAAVLPEADTDRLYPALIDDRDTFTEDVLREFSLNTEVALFAVLGGKVQEKRGRVIPLYLVISCAVMLLMTFLYNTVFGYLLTKLELPFYSLSSAADISILHRINGIDVMICEMAGIVRLALIVPAFRGTVRACFTAGRGADIAAVVFAAAALGLSELFTLYPDIFEPMQRFIATGLPLIVFTTVIPLLVLAAGRRKKA